MAKTPPPPDDAAPLEERDEETAAPDDPSGPSGKGKLSRALAGSERSLDRRWWWSAAVQAIVGIAVIGFQWEVITGGDAIWATWVMVVIGAGLIVAGALTAWRDRPGGDRE
jgi:hypothetical protein